MNVIDKEVFDILILCVGSDYARKLIESEEFMDSIKEDIRTSSSLEETGDYSLADVQFAIGRTIMKKFGIEI